MNREWTVEIKSYIPHSPIKINLCFYWNSNIYLWTFLKNKILIQSPYVWIYIIFLFIFVSDFVFEKIIYSIVILYMNETLYIKIIEPESSYKFFRSEFFFLLHYVNMTVLTGRCMAVKKCNQCYSTLTFTLCARLGCDRLVVTLTA